MAKARQNKVKPKLKPKTEEAPVVWSRITKSEEDITPRETPSPRPPVGWRRVVLFVGVVVALAGSGIGVALTLPHPTSDVASMTSYPSQLRMQYASLSTKVKLFEDRQTKAKAQLVTPKELSDLLSQIQISAASGRYVEAKREVNSLSDSIDGWERQLGGVAATDSTSPNRPPANSRFIPILLYHYTPANFDEQLSHLETHGYKVIDLDQAIAGMHGGPLPSKPVVITYDDGFADQMTAFALLKKHKMRATFYIINGGVRSRWCIGAGRRYGDPLQPAAGCGDKYMTWDQVRTLDRSGLIAIGGHTLDHENLASLSPSDQRDEIVKSKAGIEEEIGHPIKHFAYPYGAYTSTTIQITRDAGYISATTTLPGAYQVDGTEFTLHRVRDTLTLP